MIVVKTDARTRPRLGDSSSGSSVDRCNELIVPFSTSTAEITPVDPVESEQRKQRNRCKHGHTHVHKQPAEETEKICHHSGGFRRAFAASVAAKQNKSIPHDRASRLRAVTGRTARRLRTPGRFHPLTRHFYLAFASLPSGFSDAPIPDFRKPGLASACCLKNPI